MIFRDVLYKEYCKPKRMLTIDLVKKMKVPQYYLTMATHENKMTDELANGLAKVFKSTPEFWHNLHKECDKVEQYKSPVYIDELS